MGKAPSWRADKPSTSERGYTARWQRARLVFLAEHPLCVYCEREQRVTASTVVDHIVPHEGDMALFWDADNWQALCKPCHDVTKRREEGRGGTWGADANGMPLDPKHHWRRT